MKYPKEVFHINEDMTKANMREYEIKYEKWHRKAEELYPNYYSMTLKERCKVRRIIDEAVGFSIY